MHTLTAGCRCFLFTLLVLSSTARSITAPLQSFHTAQTAAAGSREAQAQRSPIAQHARALQQQSAAAYAQGLPPELFAGAAGPPSDAATALAAALGQGLSAGAEVLPPASSQAAGQAGDGLAAGVNAAAAAGLPTQRQLPQQQPQPQQGQGGTPATAAAPQPTTDYDAFDAPPASLNRAQQQQPGQQPGQQQQQQQPAQPPAALDEDLNPPNDNSELLPPPTDAPTPPASPPQPPPPDSTPHPPAPPAQQPRPQPEPGLDTQPWLNPSLPLTQRISSLLRALTLEEKIPMMIHGQAGVPRLGLPPFQFWTECLHGHQERYDGLALPTIFPQPLMLAGSFDPSLAFEVFTAISDELRAKSNAEMDKSGIHKFLTCWTPHINIFKDPRWGRGSETFGEDPFLTAAFAENIVRGLQGQEPSITKVVATCKHFLGYGLEGAEGVSRYSHNLDLAPQDLADTDLPPFQACVQAASGKGIMCSYNAVNGEPSCASSSLLKGLLRDGLGFDGYVVSDCNAVAALTWGHRTAGSYAEAAAASVKAGVDMLCDRPDLVREAVAAGTLTETDLDGALANTLRIRFLTGQFDPPSTNPWASLPNTTVNSKEHRKLARAVVHKGSVLLKNDPVPGTSTPLLPLDKGALRKVCITGPLADSPEHLMGNYYGKWDAEAALTPKRVIKEELAKAGVNVSYSRGMDIAGEIHYDWPLESTLEACADADVGLVFVGSSMVELKKTSEGDFKPATEGEGLDRLSLDLPGRQPDLIKALARRAPGLPLVVVLVHGGGLDVGWMQEVPAVRAILSVPFPGQEGGRALYNLLFGAQSPSGRLPITWYTRSYTDAVSPLNLGMRPDLQAGHPGRSYRFLQDSSSYVLYPFGYGLSYTTFTYSGLRVVPSGSEGCLNPGEGPAMCVAVTVTNTGGTGFKKPAEHAVPLYLTHMTLSGVDGNPRQSLRGSARTQPLRPGESQQLTFALNRRDFMLARASDGSPTLAPGVWKVSLGVWDAPLVVDAAHAPGAPAPAPPTVAAGAAPAGSGAATGGAVSVGAGAPGVGVETQPLPLGPAAAAGGQLVLPGVVPAGAAAAAAEAPVSYSGGPVSLRVNALKKQETGQRLGQFIAPLSAVGRPPAGLGADSSGSGVAAGGVGSEVAGSSSQGALQEPVGVDSQRGLAITVEVPSDLKWQQMKQQGLPWVR